MIQLIKDLYNAWRYKRAVKKAVKLQKLTGRKQLVVVLMENWWWWLNRTSRKWWPRISSGS